MKTQLNDEELIRQHLNTNPNICFEALYKRYVGKVYKRCLSMTKDAEKAQDFTQDIFIRTFSRLERFQERSTFSTWLYSISYNYCLDQIRVSNRLTTTRLEDEMSYQYTSTNDTEDTEERLQRLSTAMNSISTQEAMILRMKYQEGLGIHQIAGQLNLKESAVKMRLKRSREKVRQLCDAAAYQL
ncbi:RNA polymerase sigma factor [Spirosoma flavum]|uniref:RNA polymerase sigma factor n=1 Tax=Spirosoma flavum TaxID=2048557 RepID=A0ABW6AFQ9_9BACT